MKKMFLILTLASGAMFFSACKKDDAPAQLTTAQRVQQRWNFDKIIDRYAFPGFPETRDTTYGVPADYIDFRADNKVYSFVDGEYDTISYSILSDTRMILDGDTSTIQALTDNQFQIYQNEYVAANDFYEYTIYLKR